MEEKQAQAFKQKDTNSEELIKEMRCDWCKEETDKELILGFCHKCHNGLNEEQ